MVEPDFATLIWLWLAWAAVIAGIGIAVVRSADAVFNHIDRRGEGRRSHD